jgi:hypothetical protein
MDSSVGFDATGMTAVGLIAAGAVASLVEGSGSFAWAVVVSVLVGGWIPLIEREALPASAFALVLAGIGGLAGAWSVRLRRTTNAL